MSLPKTNKSSVEKKKAILSYVILAIIFFLVYSKIFDRKFDLGGDNFSYLNLTKNLAEGHGYTQLNFDGTYTPTGWFPPGYPVLLTIGKSIVGDNVIALKMINGLLFLGCIILVFSLIQHITENLPFAFSIAVLMALNSGLLRLSTIIMSEIPYLFFSLAAFYSVIKLDEDGPNKAFWKSKWLYLAIIASVISFYTRAFALVLIGAITIHWLANQKWKLAGVYLAATMALYLPYQIRNNIHGIKGRYLQTITVNNPWRPESGNISSISGFLEKLEINLYTTIIEGFPQVVFTQAKVLVGTTGLKLIGFFMLLVSFWGIWQLKRYRYLFGSYLIFNIAVLLLWHTGNGVRYVWPMAGFISFTFFLGLLEIIKSILAKMHLRKPGPYFGYLILLSCLTLFPGISELEKIKKGDYHPAYKNYFSLAKAVGKNKNSNKITIICRKPSMFSYLCNCRTSNYKFDLNDKEVVRDLVKKETDYVIFEQLGYSSTNRYLYPAINNNPSLFKVLLHLKNPDTYLIQFNKDKAKGLLTENSTITPSEH